MNVLDALNNAYKKKLNDPNFNFIEQYSTLYDTAFNSINEQFETLEKSREWLNAMTNLHVARELGKTNDAS